MKRALLGLSSAILAAGLAVIAASCGGPGEPAKVAPIGTGTATARPAASTSAAPTAAPKVDLNDPAQIKVAAWTDDQAIAALAADCNWDPGDCLSSIESAVSGAIDIINFAPDNPADRTDDMRNWPPAKCQPLTPLACARVPGQMCAPDECSQTDYQCYPRCDYACYGCAGKCSSGCQTCKSTCKDDACRLACAKTCAECHQACLTTLDHCTSADCVEESDTCFRTRDDEWNKSACPKICPAVRKCMSKCPEAEESYVGARYQTPCALDCVKKHGKGCPVRFESICLGEPNATGVFMTYHEQRQRGEVK